MITQNTVNTGGQNDQEKEFFHWIRLVKEINSEQIFGKSIQNFGPGPIPIRQTVPGLCEYERGLSKIQRKVN
jgi:hypothetical protein